MKFAMKVHQWVVTLCLLALVIAAGVGLVLTRQSAQTGTEGARRRRPPIVDETPLGTARAVAALATDRDEQRFSQQALKLADHEVDLAFSAAIQAARSRSARVRSQSSAEQRQHLRSQLYR